MVRGLDRFRLDGRHEEPLALWPSGAAVPGTRAAPAALAARSTAGLPSGRVTDPVLMAARLRCQCGCRRYLTSRPDNSRHLPAGPAAE